MPRSNHLCQHQPTSLTPCWLLVPLPCLGALWGFRGSFSGSTGSLWGGEEESRRVGVQLCPCSAPLPAFGALGPCATRVTSQQQVPAP